MPEVYGRLTVLERKGRRCICQCDCGKQVEKDWYDVKRGVTRSCGCLRADELKERTVKPVEAGSVYGRLTVISYEGKRCKCRCECGALVTVLSTKLRTGRTQSCGCYQKDRAREAALKVMLSGTRFDRLTVLKQEGEYCDCRCTCGREVRVETKKLRAGHVRSCGCLRVDQAYVMSQAKVLPAGETAFNSLYAQYKVQASTRQLVFELTPDTFRTLTKQVCYYCGADPAQVKRTAGSAGSYVYNGIDRRDNMLGYTVQNCVSACGMCNGAKGVNSEKDFLGWVKLLTEPRHTFQSSTPIQMTVPYRKLYHRYKNTAKFKKLEFDISEAHFLSLVSASCHYCGRSAHRKISSSNGLYTGILYTGIDRSDSTLGYTVQNTVPCCWDCNNAKGCGNLEDLISWAKRVVSWTYANEQR